MWKFDQNSNFQAQWPELLPNSAQTRRKHDFQEPEVALHRFNAQLLVINIISTLNYEVFLKLKLSGPISLN